MTPERARDIEADKVLLAILEYVLHLNDGRLTAEPGGDVPPDGILMNKGILNALRGHLQTVASAYSGVENARDLDSRLYSLDTYEGSRRVVDRDWSIVLSHGLDALREEGERRVERARRQSEIEGRRPEWD